MERLGDDPRTLLGAAPQGAGEITRIAAAWPAVVGAAVAAAAWPNRIGRDGTLHVATTSSVWAFELGRMQAEVLARLRAAVPALAVTSIRFAVGPVPEPDAEADGVSTAATVTPTSSDRALAAELAGEIDDDELRATVARAVAASLAKTRSDRRFW